MTIRVYLRRIRLNKGGYTDRGVYYGRGAPLYEYEYAGDDYTRNMRAIDRTHAKQRIQDGLKHLTTEVKFFK